VVRPYVPVPWPAGILTSPEIDQERGGTRPVDFAADVTQVEAPLELVTAKTRSLDRPPHPVFGPMSDGEWLRLGYLHTDHHLRQFGRLARARRGGPSAADPTV